jgi:hypothetical protein
MPGVSTSTISDSPSIVVSQWISSGVGESRCCLAAEAISDWSGVQTRRAKDAQAALPLVVDDARDLLNEWDPSPSSRVVITHV